MRRRVVGLCLAAVLIVLPFGGTPVHADPVATAAPSCLMTVQQWLDQLGTAQGPYAG